MLTQKKTYACGGYTLTIVPEESATISTQKNGVHFHTGEYGISLPPSAVRDLIAHLESIIREPEVTEAPYTITEN